MLIRRLTPTYTTKVSNHNTRQDQTRDDAETHHPLSALLSLVALDRHLQLLSRLIVLGLERLRNLRQLLNRLRLDKLLIVEVVKEQSQPLLRVLDVLRKRRRGTGSHPLHVAAQDLNHLLGTRGNV